MVNYTNSKVYKIWSTQGDEIYIGSTTKQYLSQRMDKHRSDYKRWKDNKSNFITSFKLFEEYGLENCFIELIEAKECDSKDELHKLEGKYIRELECVNKIIPVRTEEEKREYHNQYYKDNKEQLNEQNKQYYKDNKNQVLQYQKEYYESNKEKVLEQHSQIFNCECGKRYSHGHKSRHFKSIKHCKFIESQTTKPEVDEV